MRCQRAKSHALQQKNGAMIALRHLRKSVIWVFIEINLRFIFGLVFLLCIRFCIFISNSSQLKGGLGYESVHR